MKRIVLAAAFIALAPLAFAQTNMPSSGTPAAGMSPSGSTGPLEPNNCGTPDEPKACPPLPRHALKHFPAHKSTKSG